MRLFDCDFYGSGFGFRIPETRVEGSRTAHFVGAVFAIIFGVTEIVTGNRLTIVTGEPGFFRTSFLVLAVITVRIVVADIVLGNELAVATVKSDTFAVLFIGSVVAVFVVIATIGPGNQLTVGAVKGVHFHTFHQTRAEIAGRNSETRIILYFTAFGLCDAIEETNLLFIKVSDVFTFGLSFGNEFTRDQFVLCRLTGSRSIGFIRR